jgi:hypothetical protein
MVAQLAGNIELRSDKSPAQRFSQSSVSGRGALHGAKDGAQCDYLPIIKQSIPPDKPFSLPSTTSITDAQIANVMDQTENDRISTIRDVSVHLPCSQEVCSIPSQEGIRNKSKT